MRLIDANELLEDIESAKENHGMGQIVADTLTRYVKRVPIIDPETLPIVRELREKLERVTEERDVALKQLSDISDCDTCKHTECIPRGGRGKCKWEWNSGAGDHQ